MYSGDRNACINIFIVKKWVSIFTFIRSNPIFFNGIESGNWECVKMTKTRPKG